MFNTIIVTLLLPLLGYLTISDARIYSAKQCYRELEKGRKFLQQIKHELIASEYKRQMQHIRALLLKRHPIEIFNFTANRISPRICPFTPIPTSHCNGTDILPTINDFSDFASNSDNDSNDINDNSNRNDGMVPLVNWINEMHNYLSNTKDACEGPEFHNITTITMPQLGSFFSLFVINFGSPLCSICDRIFTKANSIIFSINSTEFTYTEEILYEFLLIHIPTVKTICSGLIPVCYHYYKTNVFPMTPAAKCARCNICMATTTYIQNRILLNQTTMNYVHDWITKQFLHEICLQACQLFPPNSHWDGIDYADCTTWTHTYFDNLINSLTINIVPELFCSKILQWCLPYEIPSIVNCLEEFCNESLWKEMEEICNSVRNGSLNSAFP